MKLGRLIWYFSQVKTLEEPTVQLEMDGQLFDVRTVTYDVEKNKWLIQIYQVPYQHTAEELPEDDQSGEGK